MGYSGLPCFTRARRSNQLCAWQHICRKRSDWGHRHANLAAMSSNYFPSDGSAVGFVNYQNGNGGDYRLCRGPGNPAASCTAASPYMIKGTDGLDIGANIDAINAATAGVD